MTQRSRRLWTIRASVAGLVLLAAAVSAAAEVEVTARETPRPGDRCIVCDTPLGPEDSVLIVKGRRVPVAEAMEGEFLAHPERYFSELQPRSALFTEDLRWRPVRVGWFAGGLWVLTALLAAGGSAYLAVSRGRPAARWFAIGLVGHVAGLVALALFGGRGDARRVPSGLRKVPATAPPSRCSACGREVHPNASRCAGCGAERAPAEASEARRTLGGGR